MVSRILLVEDNRDDEILVVRALRQATTDAEIVVARDGADALDYLLGNGRRSPSGPGKLPAVVLLDLKLPKIDGFEVLQRIRARESTKFLPVVVFSSSDEPGDLVRSYQCGASSFVRKPVDFDAFRQTTQRMVRYWLLLNQPPA